VRIYELAKELKISSKRLVEILSQLGIEGKSTLSSVSSKEGQAVREFLAERGPEAAATKLRIPCDPIVTFLGHVDHGKTSLLDAIRHTQVAEGEVGGITQRIGASEICIKDKRIVFIDTPGHEAFTAMRARGTQVTDIAVLVIAADDGIMPQTREAIEHARAAQVPIIVAINKIDKDNADPERVKRQLAEQDLAPEDWGGETICLEVSAVRKEGIEELLEMLLLQAEVMELSADPAAPLRAVVVESEIDRQKGPFSTLIVKEGTLRVGDVLVGEQVYGRVRALINWMGKRLQEAGPCTPVQVLGLSEVSVPGQVFVVAASEKDARRMAQQEREQAREQGLRKREKVTLETILSRPEDETRFLSLILRADSQGVLHALADVLASMKEENVEVEIVSQGVGEVKKSDILLASSSDALILTFNVPVTGDIQALAIQEEVEVRQYQVIYEMLEDIEAALRGMLEPTYEEELIGRVEIRDVFRIPRAGVIAGCYVSEGKVIRDALAEVTRSGEPVTKVSITSLKRFDRDVKEVAAGLECGIKLQGFDEFRKDDVIRVYQQRRTR